MSRWAWITNQGTFRIDEIGRSRIDLTFDKVTIGSYPTPQEAADRCGEGDHGQFSDTFDGASLRVSRSLGDWTRLDATGDEPLLAPVGVLAELNALHQPKRLTGTLHLKKG
jgi:hypothetical protein